MKNNNRNMGILIMILMLIIIISINTSVVFAIEKNNNEIATEQTLSLEEKTKNLLVQII